MKQLNLVITVTNNVPQIVVNATMADDSKFVKVTEPNTLTEMDIKFFEDLKALINEYKNNQ